MPIAGKQCENAQFSVTLRPAGRIRYAAAGQTGFGTLRPAGAVGSAGVDIRRGSDGRFSSQEHV